MLLWSGNLNDNLVAITRESCLSSVELKTQLLDDSNFVCDKAMAFPTLWIYRLLMNQTLVHMPLHSKTNLLTLSCYKGKFSVRCHLEGAKQGVQGS